MHGNPRYAQSSRLLRMILMGTITLLLLLFMPALATAAPGDPDPSFGVGGVVTFDLAQDGENVSAVALQPDGKILVAGAVMNSERNGDMLLLRYTSAGALDSSFGAGGVVVTGISPGSQDEARALLILPMERLSLGAIPTPECRTADLCSCVTMPMVLSIQASALAGLSSPMFQAAPAELTGLPFRATVASWR